MASSIILQPLAIPAIVQEVLDWLPAEQVQNCRLVSRTWNDEAKRLLRKRKFLMLHLNDYTELQKLIDLNQQGLNQYESFQFGASIEYREPRLQTFFSIFGSHITRLDLSKSNWANHPSLRKFLSVTTPNLERLTIQLLPPPSAYCHFPNWKTENPAFARSALWKMKTIEFAVDYSYYWTLEEQQNIKPYLKHLLCGMPNLETINAPKYPENLIETFQYEVQILFRESPNLRPLLTLLTDKDGPALSKLKHLNVPLKFWTNIPKLQEKCYPIESLDWFIGLDVTGAQLHGILKSYGKTLKKLTLDFTTAGKYLRECNFRAPTSFPSAIFYRKMETLELRSFKGSLSFVLQIQALKNLKLSKARNLEVMFPEEDFQHSIYSSLKNLAIDQHNPKDSVIPATMTRIGTVFNSLRVLEIRFLADNTLRAIFTSMPTLKELIAIDGLYTDAGITGIPDVNLDRVHKNNQGIPPKAAARNRNEPYVGTLANLTKLELRSKHLTDLSIFYGVLDCKSLTSLTLMAYGFTNESLMKIADEMSLSFFETVFCHQLTVAGADYIRSKLPHCELRLNQLQRPLNGLDIYRLGLFQSGTPPIRKRPKLDSSDVRASYSRGRPAKTTAGPSTSKRLRRN